MDRTKGLDPRLIGSPLPAALDDLTQDAQWLVETYEPRVDFQGLAIVQGSSPGDIIITAKLTEKEG